MKTNKFISFFADKISSFFGDARGSAALFASGVMVIIVGVGGVGVDLATYQVKENEMIAQIKGAGSFANSVYSCPSNSSTQTCQDNLQKLVNDYLAKLYPTNTPSLTVSAGVYCSNNSGQGKYFSGTSCGANSGYSNPLPAVQLSGTATTKTTMLKIVAGLNQLSRVLYVTVTSTPISGTQSVKACPGLAIHSDVLRKNGSPVTWDDKNLVPKEMDSMDVRLGRSFTYQNEYGTFTVSQPLSATQFSGSNVSLSTSELNSDNKTKVLKVPSGTSHEFSNQQINVKTSAVSRDSNYAVGKTLYDSDVGITRQMNGVDKWHYKDYTPGMVCVMSIVSGSDSSQKNEIHGAIVTIEKACNGSAEWNGSKWVAMSDDHKSLDTACGDYGSNYSQLETGIRFKWGAKDSSGSPRLSKDDAYATMAKNSWLNSYSRAKNNGYTFTGAKGGNEIAEIIRN